MITGQRTNKLMETDLRTFLPHEKIRHFCLLRSTLVQRVSTREGGSWRGSLLVVSNPFEKYAVGLPMTLFFLVTSGM